jgi:hypothetical protein
MAKVTINNGDSGLTARTAINNNFTELYTGANVHAATEKTTLVDGDEIQIQDSAATYGIKKGLLSSLYTYISGKIVAAGTFLTTTAHNLITTTPHVTATEKNTWNAKQDALGYTPENVANKKTTLTDSDTDYPTTKAVNTGLSAKQNSLGYTPLNIDQTTPQTISNGQPIQNTLTPSELVATDANKKFQSLAVATYPSLTELSYVKGVTSAIQTQFGTKIAKATGSTYTVNAVSCLTAAEYAGITPDANTIYFVV